MDVRLDVVAAHAAKVDGVKVSLLDKGKEIAKRLPAGVRMYTGDDFDCAEPIEGDAVGYSDAPLGVFDAIAPAASAALAADERARFHEILAPTAPLSRHIFRAPTLAELFRLADKAGLLGDSDLACARMRSPMAAQGVG